MFHKNVFTCKSTDRVCKHSSSVTPPPPLPHPDVPNPQTEISRLNAQLLENLWMFQEVHLCKKPVRTHCWQVITVKSFSYVRYIFFKLFLRNKQLILTTYYLFCVDTPVTWKILTR